MYKYIYIRVGDFGKGRAQRDRVRRKRGDIHLGRLTVLPHAYSREGLRVLGTGRRVPVDGDISTLRDAGTRHFLV